jgi:hypothetical protein
MPDEPSELPRRPRVEITIQNREAMERLLGQVVISQEAAAAFARILEPQQQSLAKAAETMLKPYRDMVVGLAPAIAKMPDFTPTLQLQEAVSKLIDAKLSQTLASVVEFNVKWRPSPAVLEMLQRIDDRVGLTDSIEVEVIEPASSEALSWVTEQLAKGAADPDAALAAAFVSMALVLHAIAVMLFMAGQNGGGAAVLGLGQAYKLMADEIRRQAGT